MFGKTGRVNLVNTHTYYLLKPRKAFPVRLCETKNTIPLTEEFKKILFPEFFL